MAIWKYSLILEGFGHGSSETWYFETAGETFQEAYTQIDPLKGKRQGLLAKGYEVKGDRLAMWKNNAGERVKNKSQPRQFFLAGAEGKASAETGVSLYVLCVNAEGNRKKPVYLWGVWDEVFPEQNIYNPTALFKTNFNSWVASLISCKCGWLANTPGPPIEISSFAVNPTTFKTTYTTAANIFEPAEFMKPLKVTVDYPLAKSALDGPQVVIPLSARVGRTAKPRPAVEEDNPGIMRKYSYSLVTLNTSFGQQASGTVVGIGATTHKRGRPLLVSVGRAPVRKRA